LLERLHGTDHVEPLARAARAGDDADPAIADAEALEDLEADADLVLGLGRKADADGVADARPQQVADPNRRLDRPADEATRFGDAEVERAIDRIGELAVRRHREEDVGRLYRHLIFVKVLVLQ